MDSLGLPPSLFDLLAEEFEREKGIEQPSWETFIRFANDYLAKNRPVSLGHDEMNYRITLSNGRVCVIAPPVSAASAYSPVAAWVPVSGLVGGSRLPADTFVPITGDNAGKVQG